jgi:hypothetical protein
VCCEDAKLILDGFVLDEATLTKAARSAAVNSFTFCYGA